MRRAAVSIPANIAEGFRRRGRTDKARFMNIAEGSVEECRYYVILAKDLGFGDGERLTASLEEVSRLFPIHQRSSYFRAGELNAGNPHVQFDKGTQETGTCANAPVPYSSKPWLPTPRARARGMRPAREFTQNNEVREFR